MENEDDKDEEKLEANKDLLADQIFPIDYEEENEYKTACSLYPTQNFDGIDMHMAWDLSLL